MRTRRAGASAVATILLASGCGSPTLIEDRSAAAATVADETVVAESTTATTAATAATVPALRDLLAQQRFVPMAIALERSGLDDVIEGLDEFVVLVPTGMAFGSTGTDIGIDSSILMNNPALLDAVMRYHIVANPSTNEAWQTLNGAELDVSSSDPDRIERIDGVEVLYQVPVQNGTVVVMPRLLVPAGSHDE